ITCISGITIRMSVEKISEQGRATQGVTLIRLEEDDQIAAITKLDEEEDRESDVNRGSEEGQVGESDEKTPE
ncbi:MAG: DNA gyrase C-terminal beta-propeller domain-containing protein, partial [Chitinophagaceae bacterium]